MKGSVIYFKWYDDLKDIPDELYKMTDELVGKSRIDGSSIYSIVFDHDISKLTELLTSEKNTNIFDDVSKLLRQYKIQKIIHKINGEVYVNTDMDKFSIFLEYYYTEEGNINIILK